VLVRRRVAVDAELAPGGGARRRESLREDTLEVAVGPRADPGHDEAAGRVSADGDVRLRGGRERVDAERGDCRRAGREVAAREDVPVRLSLPRDDEAGARRGDRGARVELVDVVDLEVARERSAAGGETPPDD